MWCRDRVPKEEEEIAPREASDTTLMVAVREKLPFKLTGAQDRALQDVVDDMAQPMPMMRLLQVLALKSLTLDHSRSYAYVLLHGLLNAEAPI